VWLSSRHLRTERACRKLDDKFLVPFEVIKNFGTHTYLLKFPKSIKHQPVVHVSEIESASNDPLPRQVHVTPPSVVINGEEEWEVEEVMDSRRGFGKLEYNMKWVGDEKATWHLAGDLKHVADMVELFHQKYLNKVRA